MKTLLLIAASGLIGLGAAGAGHAQTAASGTPGSPFPTAAPHEVQTIDGRVCRTVYDDRTQRRVPVACVDPSTTGSVAAAPSPRMITGATGGSAFPFAAPHEIQVINGRQCRTVYDDRTQQRVPIECVQ